MVDEWCKEEGEAWSTRETTTQSFAPSHGASKQATRGEIMARRDLSNEEIEQMGRDNPGSAAEYLKLRRQELEAEKQAQREEEDKQLFVEQFVAAGGSRSAAASAYQEKRNEEALWSAALAEEAGRESVRSRISGAL
jgi:hypothetical protein